MWELLEATFYLILVIIIPVSVFSLSFFFFFQEPSSRNRLRINFSRNVFNSGSSISEAFSSQTLPCDQADVDVVVSLFDNMLITLVDKTSQIVCTRSFVRHEEQVESENLLE